MSVLKQFIVEALKKKRFYHGSSMAHKIGSILTAKHRHLEFGNRFSIDGVNVEEFVDRVRPSSAPPRNKCIFVVDNVGDLNLAGASEDFIYEVEPVGRSYPAFFGWFSELLGLTHDDDGEDFEFNPKALRLAKGYWSGKQISRSRIPSVKEYLCDAVKIVKLVDSDQKLTESRVTPLDKNAIRSYSVVLSDEILVALNDLDKNEPIGDHDVLVKSAFHVLDVKSRERIDFPVYVRSYVDESDLVGIGAGAGVVNGEYLVEILINGKYEPFRLLNKSDMGHILCDDIYKFLLHELTHVADSRYDGRSKPKYFMPDGTIDDELYYNDPREIRAMIQDAVEEALTRASWRKGSSRDVILQIATSGRTVTKLERFMSKKNFQKVLTAIVSALESGGHIGSQETEKTKISL